ncbi:MAG: hypothetical protein ABIK65_12085 [Candidatus Eisenbacteria bacterium]
MRIRIVSVLALAALFLLPAAGESAGSGGRIGVGYSQYPFAGDMATLRYDSYSFMIEGGFGLFDRGDSQFILGSKMAVKPWEYQGIPVEIGGDFALVTDGTTESVTNGTITSVKSTTLIDLGFFVGLSTLVTDQVSVGVQIYPFALGLGGDTTALNIADATINIHFMF